MEKRTCWTQATTCIATAIAGLLSCLESGKNAWIEVQKNGDQDFPIMVPNPALNDPFNWTMLYGIPRNEKEMESHRYLNATQKDLTYNWHAAFSEPKAAEIYRTTGEITPGLFRGIGACIPVKVSNINEWREKQGLKPFCYGWVTYWQPKETIPYRIPADIPEVFVVCYDDGPRDKKKSLAAMAELLQRLAKKE